MTRKLERRCGTCKWLEVPRRKDGSRLVQREGAYRCDIPDPPKPDLPACMAADWPPYRSIVLGTSGKRCPTWEPFR